MECGQLDPCPEEERETLTKREILEMPENWGPMERKSRATRRVGLRKKEEDTCRNFLGRSGV